MKRYQKRPWFRAKRYGLGWVPISIEGWFVTLGYALIIAGSVLLFTLQFSNDPIALGSTPASALVVAGFFIWIILITIIVLWVCYKTGEHAAWRWNEKK